MKKRAKGKPTPFKLRYLREILRQAMLHATQPCETEYDTVYAAPLDCLMAMERTFRDLAKLVSDVIEDHCHNHKTHKPALHSRCRDCAQARKALAEIGVLDRAARRLCRRAKTV